MPNKKQAKILRFSGWEWEEIKKIDSEQMKIIEKSLFYSWARIGIAMRELWKEIKNSIRRIFK